MAERKSTKPIADDWQDVNDWQDTSAQSPAMPNAGLSSPAPPYIPEALRNTAPKSFLSRFSQQALGMEHPLDQAVSEGLMLADHPVDTTLQAGKQAILGVRDLAYNAVVHPANTAKTLTGGPQFAEDIANGNYKGALGTLSGGAAQVLSGKLFGGKAALPTSVDEAAISELPKYTVRTGATPAVVPGDTAAVSKRGVVDDITRAIDANPRENPGIRQLLSEQLDNVARTGTPQSKADLLKTVEAAQKADTYLSTYIEPNANLEVKAPMSYKGATTTNFSPVNKSATVEQLHARLAQINDTLYPKYNRGGAGSTSAQASIGAEQGADLVAEANAIRDSLAKAIGDEMGVDPQIVRSARKNHEQLNSLREDVQASLDRDNRLSNTGSLPHNKASVVSRIMDSVWVKPQANRLIRNSFDRYEPAPEQVFDTNPNRTLAPVPSRTPVSQMSPSQLEQMKQLMLAQRTKR